MVTISVRASSCPEKGPDLYEATNSSGCIPPRTGVVANTRQLAFGVSHHLGCPTKKVAANVAWHFLLGRPLATGPTPVWPDVVGKRRGGLTAQPPNTSARRSSSGWIPGNRGEGAEAGRGRRLRAARFRKGALPARNGCGLALGELPIAPHLGGRSERRKDALRPHRRRE